MAKRNIFHHTLFNIRLFQFYLYPLSSTVKNEAISTVSGWHLRQTTSDIVKYIKIQREKNCIQCFCFCCWKTFDGQNYWLLLFMFDGKAAKSIRKLGQRKIETRKKKNVSNLPIWKCDIWAMQANLCSANNWDLL